MYSLPSREIEPEISALVTSPQADFLRYVPRDAIIGGTAHQAQGLANPPLREHIEKG